LENQHRQQKKNRTTPQERSSAPSGQLQVLKGSGSGVLTIFNRGLNNYIITDFFFTYHFKAIKFLCFKAIFIFLTNEYFYLLIPHSEMYSKVPQKSKFLIPSVQL